MIPKYLSPIWEGLAPSLGNHLWQSTLFAMAAGALALVLRSNHARVRYWLWLAASVKFLVPFSLLIGIGSRLAWSNPAAGMNTGYYFTLEQISQPFAQSTIVLPAISRAAPTNLASLLHSLPLFLAAVWLLGFLVILSVWCLRWRRVAVAMREAAPLRAGREVEALRRVRGAGDIRNRIDMLLSRTSLEPGIFGIVRPVLIWPEGMSDRLADAHLEAILAHELRHVSRRDNLAAAIHMVVEAVFWFHPLVWWLGARLVEERERACDEEVLEFGSDRHVYAESILKVCEFCVESPLSCVAGVTGADLKKRMVYIMTDRISQRLDFGKKLLLGLAGLLAIALPITFGLVNPASSRAQSPADSRAAGAPAYQSASIKPHSPQSGTAQLTRMMFWHSGFAARGATLQSVIQEAYGVQADQISGAPDWVNSQKYDIDLKAGDSTDAAPKPAAGIGIQQLRLMLQTLLADRFKLTLHQETRELPVYSLVIGEDGPKLQAEKAGDGDSNGLNSSEGGAPKPGNMKMGPGELTDQGATLGLLVEQLSMRLGRPVLDRTGLRGNYDFTLKWTPGEGESAMFQQTGAGPQGVGGTPSPEPSGSSIFTAIQEQLGLKLVSEQAPMATLVIDHVEPPAEN